MKRTFYIKNRYRKGQEIILDVDSKDGKISRIEKKSESPSIYFKPLIVADSSTGRIFRSGGDKYFNGLSFTRSKKRNLVQYLLNDMDTELQRIEWKEESKRYEVFELELSPIDLDTSSLMDSYPEIKKAVDRYWALDMWGGSREDFGDDLDSMMDYPKGEPAEIQKREKFIWAHNREWKIGRGGIYNVKNDIAPSFIAQRELRKQRIMTGGFLEDLEYVVGVDVGFDEVSAKLAACCVLFDINGEELETSFYEEEIDYHYTQDYFSWRECPVAEKALKKLTIQPDLVFFHGHGIDHPLGTGTATNLGIVSGLPTIACSRKRMIGHYEKEGFELNRGNHLDLVSVYGNGKAICTQNGQPAIFVNIGHKISLEKSIALTFEFTQRSYLPYPIEAAKKKLEAKMEYRTELDYMGDVDFHIFYKDYIDPRSPNFPMI